MNATALRHVQKAASLLTRGEQSYRQAAAEMTAAKEAGATWPEIGDALGRSTSWCKRIVAWAETPANDGSTPTPFGGEAERERLDASATKKVLRDAPLEQVEQMLAALPTERRQAIAAAAGHGYSQARQEHEQRQRRHDEDEPRDQHTHRARQATAGFTALGIVGHIEQATEELRELQADASLTSETARKIERALEELNREFAFAKQLLGEEA